MNVLRITCEELCHDEMVIFFLVVCIRESRQKALQPAQGGSWPESS